MTPVKWTKLKPKGKHLDEDDRDFWIASLVAIQTNLFSRQHSNAFDMPRVDTMDKKSIFTFSQTYHRGFYTSTCSETYQNVL